MFRPTALGADLAGHSQLVAIAVLVITLVPDLGELRRRPAHAQLAWIAIACTLEVLSVLPTFRLVGSCSANE
jgi:hypothetical protein